MKVTCVNHNVFFHKTAHEVKLTAVSEYGHPSDREDLTGYEICPHAVTSPPISLP